MKTVNTDYNFWLSGYYDDFVSARALPDDSNTANTRTLDHTKTHFGSAIGGRARLNPRFRFSFADRTRTNFYGEDSPFVFFPGGPSMSPLFSTTNNYLSYNAGIGQWLTIDPTKETPGSYNDTPSLQYPISVCGNRQPFNATGSENYLAFVNGHDTSGTYYAPLGETDFSAGGSPIFYFDNETRTSNEVSDLAGSPVSHGQKSYPSVTFPSADIGYHTMMMTSIASVYMAEHPDTDKTTTYATRYTEPVVSPSKMPFLINQTYIRSDEGTSGTERILNYDGPLRFVGIGESFHIRMGYHLISDSTVSFKFKVGYDSDGAYSAATNDFTDTDSLMEFTLTSAELGLDGDIETFVSGVQASVTDVWCDIEVVPDFVARTFKVYVNGNTTEVLSGAIPTAQAAKFDSAYGWSLDLVWADGTDDYACVTTFIDRVSVALPLTNRFDGDTVTLPPVESFSLRQGSRTVSTMMLTLSDDHDHFSLTPLTGGAFDEEWSILMFYDGEDRPIWRGAIESISHSQSLRDATVSTIINARDSFSVLDKTLPVWELGQNAYMSLNEHLSLSSSTTKKTTETAGIRDSLLFGAMPLKTGSAELGFTTQDVASYSGGYSPLLDTRTQLYSCNPIQMYVNEDPNGPNYVYDYWSGLNASNSTQSATFYRIEHVFVADSDYVVHIRYPEGVDTSGLSNGGTITTFGPFTVGGTNAELAGTAYDGNYTIDAMRTVQNESGEWFVVMDLNSGTSIPGFPTTDLALLCYYIGNPVPADGGKTRHKFKFSPNHGLSLGDKFRLYGKRSLAEGFLDTATGIEVEVVAILDSSEIYGESASFGFTGGNDFEQTTPGSNDSMLYVDQRKMGGHDEYIATKVKPVIFKTGSPPPIEDDDIIGIDGGRAAHRVLHSRWMQDLRLSPWFRAQFGVIAPEPHWRGGYGSVLQNPIPPQIVGLYTDFASDGQAASGNTVINDITATDSYISFNDPGIWWAHQFSGDEHAIIDLLDIKTNETQFVICEGFTTPSSFTDAYWDNTSKSFKKASGNFNFEIGQIVVHDGYDDHGLNGPHIIWEIVSASEYKAWKFTGFKATKNAFAFLKDKYNGYTQGWESDSTIWFEDPDGISVTNWLSHTNKSYLGTNTGATVYHGVTNTNGTLKGLKRDWDADATIYSLRKVDESNGYKHLFVAWADMRNDGTANADGGYRKKDFGLILPTTSNYEVTMHFANQFDETGSLDVFTDLKIGEDLDLWSLDAEVEPYSAGAWSALNGASNDEPLDTRFHNWEDKGGAVLLVDVSRFWNLNTMATGGRPGYAEGGLVDFGDYETASHGFPYLIDNYWLQATPSYKNTVATDVDHHQNAVNFINDGAQLAASIAIGGTKLYLTSTNNFDTTGKGVIICEGGADRNSEKTAFYYSWNGKGTADVLGIQVPYLDNVYITSYEVVTDPKNARDQLQADLDDGASGSDVRIGSNENLAEADRLDTNFDKVRVYNTPAALFGMRLMMSVSGLVVTPNMGTYYTHDKVRYMQMLGITSSWSQNTTLPALSDINNVPRTDNFGSHLDARGKTVMAILSDMSLKEGNGLDDTQTTYAWLMGRDNRMEFRDTYDSKHALTRNELRVSNLNTQSGSKISNVRVYFNGNSQFADFPEPTGSVARWRVLNHPDVFSRDEAVALAKQEYLRETTSRISVQAEVIRPSDNSNIMLGQGRYGYVGDVFRKAYTAGQWLDVNISNAPQNPTDNGGRSLAWWTNRLGGHHFCGVQNALDAGTDQGKADLPTRESFLYFESQEDYETNFPNYGIHIQTIECTSAAGLDPTHRLSVTLANTGSPGDYQVTARLFDSGLTAITPSNSVTLTTGAGYYTITLTDSVNSRDYTVTLYFDGTATTAVTTVAYMNMNLGVAGRGQSFSFYGANSLSHALQVVSVQAGTPFVSGTSSNELRLAISYGGVDGVSGKNIYRIWLGDYSFDETFTPSSTNPTYASTLEGYNFANVTENGFVSIAVPTSYDLTQPEVLFSVNYDYLEAVFSKRCGGATNNAHQIPGDTTYSTFDTDSLFPLGMRQYSYLGDIADSRAAYYAPRLFIVRDVAYVPATTLSYTDAYVDLSSETMTIKDIAWTQNARQVEQVSLSLEKTEAHYPYTIVSTLANISRGRGEGNRPPYSPQREPSSGGGIGTSITPEQQMGGLGTIVGGDRFSTNGMNNWSGSTSNDISSLAYRNLNGRSSFQADLSGSGATWGVLGARKVGTASSFDRAIDGLDSDFAPTQGAAIQSEDGFVLGGIESSDGTSAGEMHTHSINVRVPNDASSGGFVTVFGTFTLEGASNGEITVTVTCTETSDSLERTVIIPAGSSRRSIMLLTGNIDGASVAGNNLTLEITRAPATGNDSAPYSSIVVHNVSVQIRRFNLPSNPLGGSNTMSPY